mmetsp:Transcript_73440/g.129606  ORF Transcript_73440/g.129606 Transcript_73440/m.129606 type:complete len:87 (-) Transcript_73440:12-272(-)
MRDVPFNLREGKSTSVAVTSIADRDRTGEGTLEAVQTESIAWDADLDLIHPSSLLCLGREPSSVFADMPGPQHATGRATKRQIFRG